MSDGFWKILALKGIKGGGDTPTQEKTVALDMANGNQIINPDDGKTMTQATVLKPATMAAENIKSGVDIGGVVGSLEGKLPEEEKTVTITENGTTEVNATDGKAMTKVVVTTNVAIDNNKIGQIVDGTITELTGTDLFGSTLIRSYAFNGCKNLKKIDIPNTVTRIDEYAFQNCTSLTEIIIPDSVTSIGRYAFYYCYKLTSVIIGNSVTSIGSKAFYYCDSLMSITIPDSVISIGGAAFKGCDRLTSVIILATTPPTIQSSTFMSNTIQKIVVPKGTGDVYKAATNWSTFASKIEEAAE